MINWIIGLLLKGFTDNNATDHKIL